MARSSKPQPMELGTLKRLATTGRAVVQGIAHEGKSGHETEAGTSFRISREAAERIIAEWPEPQRNIGHQMLDKYGPPNEATPTKLFWYDNRPWKRTVLSKDVVAHNWQAP